MSMTDYAFSNSIWRLRYKTPSDNSIEDMMHRVGRALAVPEVRQVYYQQRFTDLLLEERFIPAGRILINAGMSGQHACMSNCYVLPLPEDSIEGIWKSLQAAAMTLQSGGGLGQNFSSIRCRGSLIHGGPGVASGPVGLLHVWDATCRYIQSGGAQRGAMLAGLSIHHPDVLEFIRAKHEIGNVLQFFNLSLLVTDRFLDALRRGQPNPLYDPADPTRVVGHIDSQELWNTITEHIHATGEPGLLFIDRANRLNNLRYCEDLIVTNPCGEQWLPAWGSCILGSINLPCYVQSPFSPQARFDFAQLERDLPLSLRLMDNVNTITPVPLPPYREALDKTRRIGIGVFGLGTMFAMMGLRYGSVESLEICRDITRTMKHSLYVASSALAAERGSFVAFDATRYLASPVVQSLPSDIRRMLKKQGIRNSHVLSCQPTGLASAIFGNVSSGIEPIPGLSYKRLVRVKEEPWPEYEEMVCEDFAWRVAKQFVASEKLPEIVTIRDVSLMDQIAVLSAMAQEVDASIAKTVNFSASTTKEEIAAALQTVIAMDHIKGITFAPLDAPHSQLQVEERALDNNLNGCCEVA